MSGAHPRRQNVRRQNGWRQNGGAKTAAPKRRRQNGGAKTYRTGFSLLLFKEMLADVSAAIEKMSAPMPTIIMCGDFNLPIIDWSSGKISGGTHNMQRQAEMLIEFMSTMHTACNK